MCTVSYLPGSDFNILTSNRDEHISRAVDSVQHIEYDNVLLHFPQDPQAQGSWISIAPREYSYACLLNGAFIKHLRTPPYRLSRGILLLDALQYQDGTHFLNAYDLNNIEPFTLILGNPTSELEEIKWDGKKAHHILLNPSVAHLWCSPTLYNKSDRIKKEESFRHFVHSSDNLNSDGVRSWHHSQYYQDTVQSPISDSLKTLSITQVIKQTDTVSIDHQSIII